MSDSYILLALLILILIEIPFKIISIINAKKRKQFLIEYNNKFVEYCNGKGKNNELYSWLIRNSNKMQREMGIFGVVDYKPPFSSYYIKNYQVILNGLTEVRQEFAMGYGSEHARLISESLLRYVGWLDEFINKSIKWIFNPLVLLKDGVKRILSIPIFLLNSLGIISGNLASRIKENYLFNLISALFTLIGLISGLITIILGWEETLTLINRLFK